MKYLVDKRNVDGRGLAIKETLEDAKKEWASMCIKVYESTDEQVDYIRANYKREQINEVLEYVEGNCKLVHED